jgi:ribosome-binding protein aMBF1 (putative translation factor)
MANVAYWQRGLLCDDVEVADPMTAVLAARQRFERAQTQAKDQVDEARAAYGRSIKVTRRRDGKTQDEIAGSLKLTREQVRRYERYYEGWVKEHGREPVDPADA